jgi:hypothetical protein
LHDSSVGVACAVTYGTYRIGTFQWYEVASGLFVMVCNTN